jgi:large subunit ribosomal protein L18
MDKRLAKRSNTRKRRVMRVRSKVRGSESRPRLCVHKSNSHIDAQLINDEESITLVSVSTLSKELKETEFCKKSKMAAKKLGEMIAQKAKEKNISKVVFDRGRFKYHGIIAELAQAARSSGLEF